MTGSSIVYLVDDSPSIRRGVSRLLRARGYIVVSYACPVAFLAALPEDPSGCVVLDLDMPQVSGLEVQAQLAGLACNLPIVFLTGRGSISTCATALKAGAVDFLEKPIDELLLHVAIERALARNAKERRAHAVSARAHEVVGRLTEREREVLGLVVRGFSGPEIAELLGIAAGTVKVHRKHMMTKLEVDGVPELVVLCQQAGLD